MISDDVVLLQDGRYEQKIQVDRRRLEAMITANHSRDEEFDTVPSSDVKNICVITEQQTKRTETLFYRKRPQFKTVKQYSGAEVCWPSQLKIGAKTKKDPFVKVIGTIDEIEMAKKYINATLQVK
ncbi:hypothetical protein ANCDUO_11300, partial [Ancylostoma duodenale]